MITRRYPIAVLSAVVLWLSALGTASVLAQGRTPASPATQATPDSNELFVKMYPVFAHARCINCHGVVQSFPGSIRSVTADTHPSGEEQGDANNSADCGVCHEDPDVRKVWEFTAPESMWWVGKDVDQLCAMQAAQVENFNDAAGGSSVSLRGSYMNHLTEDPLITQAFRGRAGGAFANTKPSDPPSLTRAEFLAAAKAWVDAGAPCKSSGSISQVERFKQTYTYPYSAGDNGFVTVTEVARRDVQIIRLPDGSAVADSTISGNQTITIKYDQIAPAGPCTVTIISRNEWRSTTPPTRRAGLDIKLEDGKYEIEFDLAPDTTKQTSEGNTVSNCGLPPMNSADADEEITWERWVFTIRCPATFTPDADNTISCDPKQHQREPKLSGSMLRTIVGAGMDAVEPQSWLNVSPTGTSRSDNGDPLPITVNTIWNLKTR